MSENDHNAVLQQQLEDKINELSDAKSQVMKLRKTMLQQLTALGNITRPLFDLDREYFGGKFQDREDGSNPFQEVQLAVEVVNAAREHFSGQGAMGDSPELREHLGNTVEALEGLRDTVLAMRREGLEAVGLPIDDSGFQVRTFSEDNPVAALVDASQLLHEIHGVCQRTGGRIKALVAMRDDADEVRGQAEDELQDFKTSPALIAETARRETEILQGELNALRIAMAEMQERQGSEPQMQALAADVAARSAHDTALLRGLQVELERMQSGRQEDMAEVRSLAGDISMLASEMSQQLENVELDVASERLQSLLVVGADGTESDAGIGAMASAAETVFLRLAEGLQQRIENISDDLDSMAATQAGTQAAQSEYGAELEASRAEAAELTKEAQELQTQAEQLQSELNGKTDECVALQQKIEASGHSSSGLEGELAQARVAQQEAVHQAEKTQVNVIELTKSIDTMRNELAANREALEEAEEELTTLGDERRSLKGALAEGEQKLQQTEETLRARTKEMNEHATGAEQKLAQARKESQSAQEEATLELERLQEVMRSLQSECSQAQQGLEKQRHVSSDGERRLSELENDKDTAESSMRAHKQHSAELEKIIHELKENIAARDQQLRDHESKSLEISRDRDQFKRDSDRLQGELAEANNRAASRTADADRVQTESSEELQKLKTQLSQQEEGRRNSELRSHEEKRVFGDELSDLQKVHQELLEQHAQQEKDLKSVQRDYANEKQARLHKEADATDRVKSALAEVEKYRGERESQEELISQAESMKKEAGSLLQSKDADLDKLRSARDAMQRQMSEAHRQMQAMEEQQRQLIAQHKEAETAWEQQRIVAEKERQYLAVQVSDLEKKLSDNRSATAQLESDHGQQGDLMRRMTDEFDAMQAKIANRDQEVDSLGRQLDRVQRDLSQMACSRDDIATELAQTESADGVQKKTIANLNRQLRDETRGHDTQVDELKELLGSAREQLRKARSKHEDLVETDREIIAELMAKLKDRD